MLRRAVRKHNTILSAQTVTLAARRPISPRKHRGHGDFTEASGFSVHLRVLFVSVVNAVLELFLSLASPTRRAPALLKPNGTQSIVVGRRAVMRTSRSVLG